MEYDAATLVTSLMVAVGGSVSPRMLMNLTPSLTSAERKKMLLDVSLDVSRSNCPARLVVVVRAQWGRTRWLRRA